MLELHLADHAVAVDEGAIEATEVAQDEGAAPKLDQAVLLRHDFVQQLDGIARMPPKRIILAELNDLLPFSCRQDKTRHEIVLQLTWA